MSELTKGVLHHGWSRRDLARLMAGAGLAASLPSGVALAQGAQSLNLAMIGEPQTLDPMASTADLVSVIMMHVYESLYTFDADLNAKPMLAVDLPKISADGKTYEFEIRKGVKLHSGRDLDVEDVIASLRRWMDMTPRGKSVAASLDKIEAKGTHGVVVSLKAPVPAFVLHMALPSGYAAIMAKESIASPLTTFVGTGPYKFQERRPDQFVILTRFDGYSARSEPSNGYAGKREAKIPELRSSRSRTPTRASKASSPASIISPTSCRLRRSSASPRPRASSRSSSRPTASPTSC